MKSPKQLSLKGTGGWGGRRRGAGRPNKSGQVNHMKREHISSKTPLNITLRLKAGLPNLRRKTLFSAFKDCIKGAKELDLRVIQFSVQSNHIHLICECGSNRSLQLGMRALAGRFAKIIRTYAAKMGAPKSGSVFEGRYHLRVLKTPTEVKNALRYVLLNQSKHRELIEFIDEFSSGRYFRQWRRLLGRNFKSLVKFDAAFYVRATNPPVNLPLRATPNDFLSEPRSWLAREGWLRAA